MSFDDRHVTQTGQQRQQSLTRGSRLVGVVVPILVAAGCVELDRRWPTVGPLMLALVVGGVVANLGGSQVGSHGQHAAGAKLLLRVGVVLVGLRLSAGAVASLGAGGIAVALVTVAITFWATSVLGARLGLERGLVTLVAAGFSVCGAAAIAAVEGGVQRRSRDVALAVGMVTLFGTAMVVVLPLVADATGMSQAHTGIWAGASIHEVAQVVAASSVSGPAALALATTVKLTRVAVLPAVYVVATAPEGAAAIGRRSLPTVPWFVTGFLLAVGVRTTGLLSTQQLEVADRTATLLLAAGMYGLGLGLRARDLLPVPFRLLVLCTASTLTAAGTSAALTLTIT